jgi:tRNA (cmo5U34)-methyltransferase
VNQERPRPERMAAFFDARTDTYEEHMRSDVANFDRMYSEVCACFPASQSTLEILDIGCGTGLELGGIFQRVPNARVLGIDVSEKMLAVLKARYSNRANQITLVCTNYLDYAFGKSRFDCAFSVWSLHHLLPYTKRSLYRKVRASLKHSGRYIECD